MSSDGATGKLFFLITALSLKTWMHHWFCMEEFCLYVEAACKLVNDILALQLSMLPKLSLVVSIVYTCR